MIEIVERIFILVVQLLRLDQEVEEGGCGNLVGLDHALFSEHCVDVFELPFGRGFIKNV